MCAKISFERNIDKNATKYTWIIIIHRKQFNHFL